MAGKRKITGTRVSVVCISDGEARGKRFTATVDIPTAEKAIKEVCRQAARVHGTGSTVWSLERFTHVHGR